jgi:hypothetical protein
MTYVSLPRLPTGALLARSSERRLQRGLSEATCTEPRGAPPAGRPHLQGHASTHEGKGGAPSNRFGGETGKEVGERTRRRGTPGGKIGRCGQIASGVRGIENATPRWIEVVLNARFLDNLETIKGVWVGFSIIFIYNLIIRGPKHALSLSPWSWETDLTYITTLV